MTGHAASCAKGARKLVSYKAGILIVKCILDLVLLILSYVWGFKESKYPATNSTVPNRFTFYTIESFDQWDTASIAVDNILVGKKLCADINPNPGCVLNTAHSTQLLEEAFQCDVADSVSKPLACSYCIPQAVHRIFNATAPSSIAAGLISTNPDYEAQKKQMFGCMARQPMWSVIKYKDRTNIWIHVMSWSTLMFTASLCLLLSTTVEQREGNFKLRFAYGFIIMVCAVWLVLISALWGYLYVPKGSSYMQQTGLFDCCITILIQAVMLLLVSMAQFQSTIEHTTKDRSYLERMLIYDTFLLIASPNMVTIVCSLNQWLEWNFVLYMILAVMSVFAMTMHDNAFSFLWTRVDGRESELHKRIHVVYMMFIILVLIFGCTQVMPSSIVGDEFSASASRYSFLLFVVSITLLPSYFNVFSSGSIWDMLYFKEGCETLFKITMLILLYGLAHRPHTGQITSTATLPVS